MLVVARVGHDWDTTRLLSTRGMGRRGLGCGVRGRSTRTRRPQPCREAQETAKHSLVGAGGRRWVAPRAPRV